jgi:ADP-ribosylation factor-like protein 2
MGASLLVFSNKIDVGGCMSDDEIREAHYIPSPRKQSVADPIQALQLDSIKTHRWTIVRCSAITGEHLRDGLQWVVQDAKDRLFLY